ncbi:hypothetical protein BKA70DRAFT_1231024 [Coprinopsis sp. MPI-PUGE-AT-0042]|nr:hypothetical protein BKA70DRAFT_1231024 [Coprinopsis sp. MPI-PUGE-AT-0042]
MASSANKENDRPPMSQPESHALGEGSNSWDENAAGVKRKRRDDGEGTLSLGPKKRPARTDPLVHIGRHFGRTVQTFCRIQALLKEGIAIAVQLDADELSEEELPEDERREYQIYKRLLKLSPKLEERLYTGSEQDIYHIGDMISKGSANARSDDTRALKSSIVDWITPHGGVLVPPLQRNVKTDRGFHHDRTGQLLCPATLDWSSPSIREDLRSGQLVPSGEQWPLFLYQDHKYDPQDPWRGLLRGPLLIKASSLSLSDHWATRCSNSRLHGMTSCTVPSIAYIATQVRFALSSTAVFSRNDKITDSERFYNSIVGFLEDPEEHVDVKKLLVWWDRQIFPKPDPTRRPLPVDESVYAKIKEKRRKEREARANCQMSTSSQSGTENTQDSSGGAASAFAT